MTMNNKTMVAMTSPYILALALLSILLIVYKVINLYRYRRQAELTGLPYVITPFLETEIVALLATPLLRWLYHKHLDRGTGWPVWCRFIIKDWQWEDKRLAHEEYGDTFLCVSPEGIICYTADASIGWDVMNRRNDFTKPRDKYKILEPYGPNVATAEGPTYRFHVRIVAPPFGDGSGANELVWKETIAQTKKLSRNWAQKSSRNLQMDVNYLTLTVISLAGFGKSIEWASTTDGDQDVPPGYQMSFLKAINDTTTYMVSILLFPGWLLNLTPFRKIHLAHSQLDKYMRAMIRTEKKALENDRDYQSSKAKGNLLTAIMRASATETQVGSKEYSNRKHGFTEDEVMGNLFIYLLAGYETTANAITYGLVTLALRQDVQSKVIEEIDAVYAEAASAGREELTYQQDFEKLKYTYGFMYETFRLFPGVTLITKCCLKPQPIRIGEKDGAILPAHCRVYLSAPGVHYNPKYWPDPYKLDPHRWDTSYTYTSKAVDVPRSQRHGAEQEDSGLKHNSSVMAERTRHMRGTLLTFSDGARTCLGRKFAQSEYMAFLAAVLREYKVILAPGMDGVKVERDLYGKSAGKLTLAMADGVRLELIKRGHGGKG